MTSAWFLTVPRSPACFERSTPQLTDAAFDAIWNRAGDSDAARGTTLTAYLSRTLFTASSAQQDGETVPTTNNPSPVPN